METEGSLPCSQESPIGPPPDSDASHPVTLRSILMLYSHLRLGLPTGLFPSGFSAKIMCALLISLMCATYLFRLILLDLEKPNNIWWSVQVMKLLIMQSSPPS
jgi:hypothetical protein